MLSIEDMGKSAKEFNPDGFELIGDRDGYKLQLPNDTQSFSDLMAQSSEQMFPLWDLVYYPLFLQRVIEGINDSTDHRIKQEGNIFDVYLYNEAGKVRSIKQIGGDTDDEAKETVIKYVLEEMAK